MADSSADVSSTTNAGCSNYSGGASEIDVSASWTLNPTSMSEIVCEIEWMEANHSDFTFGVASDTASTTNTNLKVSHVWYNIVNFRVRVWDPDHPTDSHDVQVDFEMHVLTADWSIDVGNSGEVGSVLTFNSVATLTCNGSTATGTTLLSAPETATAPLGDSGSITPTYLPSATGDCLYTGKTHNNGEWVAASYKFEVSSCQTSICQPSAAGTYPSEVTVAQAGWVKVCAYFQ